MIRPLVLPVVSLALLALLALLVAPLGATSYVMMTDEDLLAQTGVVIRGRILAAGAAPGTSHPATDYLLEVDEVFKGFVPAGTLVVRVAGGEGLDGIYMQVWGAPRFRVDERVILFLGAGSDGTYRVSQFGLGAFREVVHGGRRLAVRDLSDTRALQVAGDARAIERSRSVLPRDVEGFTGWLSDRAAGIERAPDYFVDDLRGGAIGLGSPFTLFESPGGPDGCGAAGGRNIRIRAFDSGGSITYRAHTSGQDGIPGGGFTEIQQALAAWNNDAATMINMKYGGTTNNTNGSLSNDGVWTVLPNDPNDEIEGSFSLIDGGILAVTTIWLDCGINHSYKGKTYHTLLEADLVTQDGVSSFFFNSTSARLAAAELFGHEFGHGLGIGHSCGDDSSPNCSSSAVLNDALMRASVHDDDRGARLNSDDRAAAAAMYTKSSGGPSSPSAPTDLTATAMGTDQILLSWKDTANNETSFDIQEKVPGGAFATLTSLSANATELIVSNLEPESYRAYRVRASNSSGSSSYSNEASTTTDGLIEACVEDDETLCLNKDRIKVTLSFNSTAGSGQGQAVEMTPDTGYFWFFNKDNVELVVKVLDKCKSEVFNSFWVFAGGLTDVEVMMTVVDTEKGPAKTYLNPPNTAFQPINDTSALKTCP